MAWKFSPLRVASPLLVACLTTFITPSNAAPVLELPHQVSQPDGTTFTVVGKGDEWNNRTETLEGYTVAKDNAGIWYYVSEFNPQGKAVLGSTRAQHSAPPGLSKHLRSPAGRPELAPPGGPSRSVAAPLLAAVQTNTPVLFILAEFSNRQGITSESDWGSFVANNVRDFYLATSHGNADMDPAGESFGIVDNGVVGWVNLGYPHPNTRGNIDNRNLNLTADAIAAADSYIDYASYDSNQDGWLDGDELSVVVIAAGYETAYGGTTASLTPNLWGHQWGWSNNYPTHDGVKITQYAQFGELHATSAADEHQATMGIMVHELGHLSFGLPDLYDIDGSSSGIGDFGVMSGGSWGQSTTNGDIWAGETPVNACAWTKYSMNWVNGDEGSGTELIQASGSGTDSDTVFRASSPQGNEYFLVENRRPSGYDLGLEISLGTGFSGGVAIWHIDDSRSSNSSDSHRWVDLEEADGTQMGNSYGSNSDLWSISNGGLFDDSGNPNSKLYNGSSSGVVINVISSSSDAMSVEFGIDTATPPDAPSNLVANAVSSSQINLVWNDNANNETSFTVEQSLDESSWATLSSGLPADMESYDVTGLQPLTPYYFRILASNDSGASDYSNTASATTLDDTALPVPSGLGASGSTNGSVTLSWNDVDGESGYELQREQYHRRRDIWGRTQIVGNTAADETTFVDSSGFGTFRYRVRALSASTTSEWSEWVEIDVSRR